MKIYKFKIKRFLIILGMIFCFNIIPSMTKTTIATPIDGVEPASPFFTETNKSSTDISHYKDRDGSYRNRVYIEWTPPINWGIGSEKYQSLYFYPRTVGQRLPVQTVDYTQDTYTFEHPLIKSGTIYDINVQGHGVQQIGNKSEIYDSHLSNTLSVMTDIELKALPISEDSINIEWDDVIYNGNHISYELYISTNKDFTNVNAIYIDPDTIGSDKAVKSVVVQGRSKLSYTHKSNLSSGTVYYIKIKPIVSPNSNIIYNFETETIVTYTNIVARLSLFSTTGSGQEIWKLNWVPITAGSISEDEQTVYRIVKTDKQTGNIVMFEAKSPPQYLVFNEKDKQFQYRVEVHNFRTQLEGEGQHINIYSNWLKAEVQDTPYTPTTPVIEETIGLEHMEVTEDSIKLLWKAPLKPGGGIDNDIWYDIWLLKNLEDIDNIQSLNNGGGPQADITIQPSDEHFIKVSDAIIGYKYNIIPVEPNTVYYIVIKAKKSFQVEDEDGKLEVKHFSSDIALKTVVTKPGDIGEPDAMPKPPFGVKIHNNKPAVDKTTATLVWDNEWYEIMHKTDDDNWNLVTKEEYDNLESSVDKDVYHMRHVKFDNNITFELGYIIFTDDLEGAGIEKIRELDVKQSTPHISNIPNNTLQTRQEYTIVDLSPNTEYLIWIKAVKSGFSSDVSNPVAIITKSDSIMPTAKPPVQIIHKHDSNDTSIDLTWWSDSKQPNKQYTYLLRYSEQDDISKSAKTITITYEDLLLYSGGTGYKQFITVDGLKPETDYYFWIMAEVKGENGETKQSDWSDSYFAATLAYRRPETPKGFGVKQTKDGTGKNHIFYEWILEEQLNYILEISEDISGKNRKTFNIANIGEYKVEGLQSNVRYYAVLYAYDTVTKLKSYPTDSISVKTSRSDDDYDSDGDNETVIDWDIIDSRYEDGIWVNEIIGVNADRFIEMIYNDNYIDYILDLSDPSRRSTTKKTIRISNKVFDALSQIKENLIINIGKDVSGLEADRHFIFRPDTINLQQINIAGNEELIVNISFIDLKTINTYFDYNNNLTYKSGITDFDVWIEKGNIKRKIDKFKNDVKIIYPFRENTWIQPNINQRYLYSGGAYIPEIDWSTYSLGSIQGYILDEKTQKWILQEGETTFSTKENWGYTRFAISSPGKVSIFKKEDHMSFYDIQGHWAYDDIQKIILTYELPGLDKTGYFRPDENVTVEEGVKLILDIVEYEYDSNYMQTAYKAGITKDITSIKHLSRQEIIVMLMKLYQLKTGEQAVSNIPIQTYKDADTINYNFLPIIRFASQIGVIIGKTPDTLAPAQPVTRAEVIAMLKRVLSYMGEI